MPGRLVLDVYASGPMEVRVKVNEQERANVVDGQSATVRADALPGRPFEARVSSLAGAASRGGMFDEGGGAPGRSTSGSSSTSRSRACRPARRCASSSPARMKNVLTVPRQALFQKNGKPVVYCERGPVRAA